MLKSLFILLIRIYQAVLSSFLGSNCRHEPTCSNYGVEALKEWGAIKGFWLTIKRISKCRPGGTFGYDPVPKKNANDE